MSLIRHSKLVGRRTLSCGVNSCNECLLDRRQHLSSPYRSRQIRELGFLGAVARTLLTRAAVVVGGIGATGYAIDKKVRTWEEEYFGPVVDGLDAIKGVARPGADLLRDFKDDFFSKFNVEKEYKDFEKIIEEQKREEKRDYENENGQKPDAKLPATVAAAIFLSEKEDDPNAKKDYAEKDLASLANELEELRNELANALRERRIYEERLVKSDNDFAEVQKERQELLSTIRRLQDSASQQEVRHHRKVEKLESECSDLHQRLAHAKSQKKSTSQSQAPKSMVEQYSQVLDELEHARLVCPNVDPPDLPRVIVVGDQSSGKTSVLEAVARARIFPRGGGQMMTRSPVKVTIADGPRHIASFPDQPDKYYRLDDEEHLKQLRSQIEHRMARACHGGLTISSEVVPINVEGPGLRRMVLVDLPGLICTETAGIRPGTAAEILNLAREQMDFPNAIILCVQDGSVDAERSQVTNYVREADPTGERTLLVLTKVDKAVADPVRLKQILDGKLFPLRALGYFAVVTGNENKDASIAEIRKSENQFFQRSPLLNSGILQPDQLGTNNLCDAVSKLFWRIVKNSLSGELQKLKEQLFILESEWKAQYRHRRELDRDQTFGRVKEQLFDRMVLMKNLDPGQFENDLKAKLWETVESYFLHEVYLAAEDSAKSKEEFKAISDLRLRKFSNQELPNQSLEAVRALLIARFAELVLPELSNEANAEHTTLYQKISNDVQREFDGYFKSNKTARASELRVIQQSTIENRFINSKIEWQSAADRLKITLHNDVEKRWAHVWDAAGPVWYQQYWNWTARTKDQHEWDRIKRVLQILPMDTQSKLTKDQLAKARFDIQKFFSIEATEADIDDVWRDLYPTRWIAALEKNAAHCRGSFQKYKDGKVSCESSRLQCEDVMLWWRMDRALEMSAANLRQFMLTEGVDTLANELQNSLDNLSENNIVELIKGRQVELAEELKYIRKIHGLLHELNRMLNQVYGQ